MLVYVVCLYVFHLTYRKQVYIKLIVRGMFHGKPTQLVILAGCSLECCQFNFDVLHSFSEAEIECALQLRRIGDKLSFLQKLLNLMYKLFGSGT